MKSSSDDELKKKQTDIMDPSSILRSADIINQHILLHPFIALRRTCQVNRKCLPIICAQPFSLIPFIFHQQRKQGLFALYRGLTSELLVKGLVLGTETAIANYLEWPTEIDKPRRYVQDSLKVLALRGLSIALTAPFLCSAVIETVQSVIILRDRPSFLDCIKDGFLRLVHIRSNSSSRMLPIWLIVVPTVCFHVSRKVILEIASKVISWSKENLSAKTISDRRTRPSDHNAIAHDHGALSVLQNNYSNLTHTNVWPSETDLRNSRSDYSTSLSSSEALEKESDQISTTLIASLIADVFLLPAETILNSLYIQGTRTIIDNCDETTMVLPVLTNYDGFSDCLQSIIRFEGQLGLYKGLGAIVLQYALHFVLFRSLCLLLKELKGSSDSESYRHGKARKSQPAPQTTRENLGMIDNNRHSTPYADYSWLRQPEDVYAASPLQYDLLSREMDQ